MKSFLIRWGAALALVLVTYNPTSLNYVRWAIENSDTSMPIVLLLGLVLLVAYVVFLRATFRSIGFVGIGLVVAVVAAFLWVLTDFGIINLETPGVMTWIGLIAASLIMGIGLSWSIIRRMLSGQLDVDDVDQQ